MARRMCTVLGAIVLLALIGPSPAADKVPAGTWKMTLPLNPAGGGSELPLWLLSIQEKDGAWSGKMLAGDERLGKAELLNLSVKDGVLRFAYRAGDNKMSFEGKVPEGDAQLLGTLTIGQDYNPAILERTALTSLDKNEINKDVLATSKDSAAILKSAIQLVSQAGFLKAKPEDVRTWVAKALDASKPFGERWQRDVLLTLVEVLNEQDGMAAVTVPFANQAERMLVPKDRPTMHKRTLNALITALEKNGKGDEAKEVAGRLKKLDLTVRTQTYAGRDAKHNRVAVFELFTGTECPPCVAADMGFEALLKCFKPADVILLQYHEHIPGPDPLATEQTLDRFKYYAEAFAGQVGGTPTTLANGTPAAPGGGGKVDAQDKYDQYYDALTSRLDEAAKVKLTAKAERKGDKIDIKADVAELKDPGKSIMLRLVLVEDEVEYKGGNGIEKHHRVVRAFPGGIAGVALTKAELKHTASIDLAEVRKGITKHVQDIYKKADEDAPKMIPLEMKKLKVVALVQDDNTREILQAIQVEVEEAK